MLYEEYDLSKQSKQVFFLYKSPFEEGYLLFQMKWCYMILWRHAVRSRDIYIMWLLLVKTNRSVTTWPLDVVSTEILYIFSIIHSVCLYWKKNSKKKLIFAF